MALILGDVVQPDGKRHVTIDTVNLGRAQVVLTREATDPATVDAILDLVGRRVARLTEMSRVPAE